MSRCETLVSQSGNVIYGKHFPENVTYGKHFLHAAGNSSGHYYCESENY